MSSEFKHPIDSLKTSTYYTHGWRILQAYKSSYFSTPHLSLPQSKGGGSENLDPVEFKFYQFIDEIH
jgi:hypothetical protein